MLYRCSKGCIGESPFECMHGGSRAKAVEPDLNVDETQVRTVVEKAIREAVSPKYWNSPGWQRHRTLREIKEQHDRLFKRGQVEGYRRLAAKAEYDIQRSNDLASCPLLPLPQVRL